MSDRPTDPDEGEDFATLLARFESEHPAPTEAPKIGDKVRGAIFRLGEDTAFVDLGGKAEAMVDLDELRDEEGDLAVEVGDEVEAVVAATDPDTGALVLRVRPGRSGTGNEAALAELEQAFAARIPVEGRVTGVNKGGLEAEVSGVRAFCPVSQIDLGYVQDPAEYVGRRLSFRITRFDRGRGRHPDVVLSRRELLAEEAAAKAAEARARLEPGKTVRGTVTSLAGYGAFVDLGGIDGLLHISEIGHQRIEHPSEVLTEGQELEVVVLEIEPADEPGGRDRISLSLRSLAPDPWQGAAERFPEGTTLTGKVVRLAPFGAFVQLAPGVDGLVHISELGSGRRLDHPRQAVEEGQELRVEVLSVDTERKRISLAPAEVGEGEGDGEGGAGGGDPGGHGGRGGGLGTLGDLLKDLGKPE